ncbi:DUF393 domain-containing protein [Desertivirga arenae]|uniref:DUF393 domain-containing protein n=1 Tax=Desertivirga arenae TaxID=2810309 RepID=UPI001A959791|nr:DUF393 domain-containing protein [Pedobacter sp. SYSU D00823]
MKALKNHLILFDAECPMCRIYTSAFVKGGMLDANGRAAYQELPEQACPMLDRQRAANEIALVNQETGEVTYGIESLFKVFAVAFPVFKPLFLFKPFVWIMSKVYAFIAFNRRVIVPPSEAGANYAIQPSFKLGYRVAYLIFTWLVTASILSAYTQLLQGLIPAGEVLREYLICGGQILFQGIIISFIDRGKRWDYLGNMMTISMAGALLLLPFQILHHWFSFSPTIYAVYFMAVAGLMLLEHIRRTKLLKTGWTLTLTWVLYRLLILLLIL